MKRKIISLLTLVIMLFSVNIFRSIDTFSVKTALAANCNWVMLTEYAPQSFAKSIAIDPVHPDIIYAAIGPGLYKSKNYGINWTQIVSGARIWDIAIDYKNPMNVYITEDNGLYKSTDGGIHWKKTLSKNTAEGPIEIDPNNPKIIYAGDRDGKIYRSTNAGNSWTYLKDLGKWNLNDISVSKNHSNIVYACLASGLFKSVNSGQTWTTISLSHTIDVKVSPVDDKFVYAIFYKDSHNSVVYKSSDGGVHWTKIFGNGYANIIEIDPHNPNIIYVTVWGKGIYKSADGGKNWQALNTGLKTLSAVNIVVEPEHSSVLYCVTREPNLVYQRIYRYVCPISPPANFGAYFSGNSINFSWEYPKNADVDYFSIAYKQAGSSTYKMLATHISKDKRRYTKTNFTSTNTSFEFIISAYMENSHSSWAHDSARHLAKPSISAPKTFSNSAAFSKIKITWNRSSIDSHADYIVVWRSNPDCSGYLCLPVLVKKIAKGSEDFNKGYIYADNLKFDKKYTISVAVYDKGSGKGTDTNINSKTIFIPDIPKNFEVYSYGDKIRLSWDYNETSASHIDNFKVYMLFPHLSLVKTLSASVRNTILGGSYLGKGIFVVKACKDGNFTGSKSDTAYILKKPDAPLLSVENGNIKIRWDKNTIDLNADKINIYRSENSGPFSLIASVNKNAGEYIDPSAMPNTLYYYAIKAVRTVENKHSDISDYSQPSHIESASPDTPSNLTATARSCAEVALRWEDNSDDEEHFVIERKEEGGSYGMLSTVGADTTSYTDGTVEDGKTYYYRVKAVNGAGESGYSNEARVRVPECSVPPNAPSNLTATVVSSSEVDLFWKDNSDNEDGFKIERKVSGGTYETVATVGADKITYRDSGLTKGVVYYYRVKAFNDKGDSDYSNEVSVKIPSEEKKEIVIKLWPDNEYMFVNGKKQEIDPGRGTKPVIIPKWGRTVVPIRAIVEALGGTIEWDGTERKVTINFNDTVIELWIDKPKAKVNGVEKWIDENNHDVRPIIVNDRTMLPLRFVAESLGCEVKWDNDTRTITIKFSAK